MKMEYETAKELVVLAVAEERARIAERFDSYENSLRRQALALQQEGRPTPNLDSQIAALRTLREAVLQP